MRLDSCLFQVFSLIEVSLNIMKEKTTMFIFLVYLDFQFALTIDQPNPFFSSIRVNYVLTSFVSVKGYTTSYSCKKIFHIHAFFINNTFISNARLKLAKNQTNAKQHPEAELLLLENYSHSWSKNKNIFKKISKRTMYLYSWGYTINHNENEDENEKYIT